MNPNKIKQLAGHCPFLRLNSMSGVLILLITPKAVGRFWAKVDKNGPIPKHAQNLGRCWRWKSTIEKYGTMHLCGKNAYAHRISWTIHNGNIPGDLCVLHKCDNPECTNPNHLFLGDDLKNMRDKVEKGRQSNRFSNHYLAKLKGENLSVFKRRILSGEKPFAIAADFGVSFSTACRVAKLLKNEK